MIKTSEAIAGVSLVISLVSLSFSFMQWRQAGEQQKAMTAIDISRAYQKDNSMKQVMSYVKADMNISYDGNFVMLVDRLDYIAYLANTHMINADYLSLDLKCTIFSVSRTVERLERHGGNKGVLVHEMSKMPKDPRCPLIDQMSDVSQPAPHQSPAP